MRTDSTPTCGFESDTRQVFAIGNQHLTGPQMAARYTTNIHRILQRSRKPGPFVDIVQADRVQRRWPTDAHQRHPQR